MRVGEATDVPASAPSDKTKRWPLQAAARVVLLCLLLCLLFVGVVWIWRAVSLQQALLADSEVSDYCMHTPSADCNPRHWRFFLVSGSALFLVAASGLIVLRKLVRQPRY